MCKYSNNPDMMPLNDFGIVQAQTFAVGQLVMRLACSKTNSDIGPFEILKPYKSGRATRYRIKRVTGHQEAGVTVSQIRAMTDKEIQAFNQQTQYQHCAL